MVQAVEIDKFLTALDGERLFPFVVRLGESEPSAYEARWPLINAEPEKHQGYAVQWFTMAAALALIFIIRSSNIWQLLRSRKKRTSKHE